MTTSPKEVSVNGSIRFPNRETLSFDVQVTVEDVLVQAGDRVEEGQELARLDQATVASPALSEAQTKLAPQEAEDALAEARDPHSALDAVIAEDTRVQMFTQADPGALEPG